MADGDVEGVALECVLGIELLIVLTDESVPPTAVRSADPENAPNAIVASPHFLTIFRYVAWPHNEPGQRFKT